MTIPQITALPDAPTPQDAPEVFNDKSFRHVAAQSQFVAEANVLADFVAEAAQAASGAGGSAAAANESALAARDVAVDAKAVTLEAQAQVSAVATQFGDVAGAIAGAEAAQQGAQAAFAQANAADLSSQAAKAQAEAAVIAAELARDASFVTGPKYATEAIGRAAVADGVNFLVQGSGDVAAFEYRRTNSDTSALIASYPSANAKIAPDRTVFLTPGKNLFDKAAATLGKYLTETGVLGGNPAYSVSDYIAVEPGESYYANASGMRYTCYFDRNKNVQVGGSDVGTSPFTVPPGISYVRVTLIASDIDIFQFENGPTTGYEPFHYRLALPNSVPIVPQEASLPPGWLSGEKIKDHAVDSTHLRSEAVTPVQTSFLPAGKNKFNPRTVTAGKYITANGVLIDNPEYDTSDYIPVRPGPYRCNVTGIRFSCNYDANQNVVAGGYNGDGPVDSLSIPDGVAFVRIAVGAAGEFLQLEKGVAVTAFEPYRLYLGDVGGTPILVAPEVTNFLPLGKNKFNKNTVTVGEYLTPGGGAAPNESYDYSDFIPVRPGQYTFNLAAVRMSCYFNEKKEVVPGGWDGALLSQITIPDGVAFVRITVEHHMVAAIQMEEGGASTTFEEYRYELRSASGIPIHVDVVATPSVEGPALAATQYIPNGKEIALYLENVVRDYQSVKGHVGISFLNGRETGEATKLIPSVDQVGAMFNGNAVVIGKDFDFIVGASGKSIQIRISDASKATPINVQNIGDSFTGRMTWANVINATPAAVGITYSGNRTANSTDQTVKCEGQGGWTMQSYFTVDFSGYLSPFMQPVNAYKHFGPTSFWIDANSPEPSYNAANFSGIREQFDAVTGRKKAPAVNDVMSDGGGYIVWNGAVWVGISLATLGGFAFDYGKYRAAWGMPQPSILHVLLGTNDFYSADANSFPGTYATYKTRYEQLIASVKADSPACKIIVGIPVSSGRQGEYGTLTTERVKRAMWLLAKNLVADFDGREAEGIYLLDYHSVVHRVYGFDTTPEKPMEDYSGPDTYKYMSDITHCSLDGFKQMGNVYMGLIQHLR